MKILPFVLILALVVSGCAAFMRRDNLPTAVPVALELTPAPPSTQVPSPVPTEPATPTPDPDADVLTIEQKEQLHQASLKYLAATDGDAVRVARDLNFVDGADVSNMCGPLAITIMRDAGLVSPDTDNHDFWLLNPRQKAHRVVLDRVFPAQEYTNILSDQPINEYDFKKFPLKAGDFLYLYAGPDGSFEHMLVVTRVDEAGRAYTVTNVHTDFFYFAIPDLMLYDPTQPGVGQFYDWTNKEKRQLGLTGYGGFEIWRRTAPLLSKGSE